MWQGQILAGVKGTNRQFEPNYTKSGPTGIDSPDITQYAGELIRTDDILRKLHCCYGIYEKEQISVR